MDETEEKIANRRISSLIIGLMIMIASVDCWPSSRSYSARAEFKRNNPCPSTGSSRGPCPGFQIDHINPLKCQGPDLPHNMQWLSVDDHKEKTRREAGWCRQLRTTPIDQR